MKELVLEDDHTKEELLKKHHKCLNDLKKYKDALANSNYIDEELVSMCKIIYIFNTYLVQYKNQDKYEQEVNKKFDFDLVTFGNELRSNRGFESMGGNAYLNGTSLI